LALAWSSTPTFAAQADKLAPIHRAEQPIKDAQGRVEVIVDLDFNADKDTEFSNELTTPEELKWDGHRGKTVKFLNKFEKKYGLSRSGMTSWTVASMTGFVTEAELQKIAKDKLVKLITENERVTPSAFFQATDTVLNGESYSWGWKLTNNNFVLNAGTSPRRVYVIDGGIADHDDLNVVERTNVACGTGVRNCSTGLSNDQFPVVSCYPHATHVAGIVGAYGNNSKTSAGVYSGVKLYSVGASYASGAGLGKCSDPFNGFVLPSNTTISSLGYAFDWVTKSTLLKVQAGDPRVPIVTMSINPGRLGFDSNGIAETNRAKLLDMVTPAANACAPKGNWDSKVCVLVNYPGAFFAQSAGNQSGSGRNICSEYTNGATGSSWAYQHAYPNNNTTNPNDGVMVVGAIHSDGVSVDVTPTGFTPAKNRPFSATTPVGLTGTVASSNFGGCVDVWAPGNAIYSTWCDHAGPLSCVVGTTYSGNGNSGTRGWGIISGTSMAAPFVAGAAAYLADAYSLATPAAIEQAVRQRFFATGSNDRAGNAINIVQLP
jgi:subtilisin family serine protease